MAVVKLGRKEMPSGYNAGDFQYMGRPSIAQGDFGADVGIADMACVDQFGTSNTSKGYHGGVVQDTKGAWWVYLEWGRIQPGKSWVNGSFRGQDFQFVQCGSETEARSCFAKQIKSKNTARLSQKDVGGTLIWAAQAGKDGYIIQSLATRERGLPDAYSIKDDSGVRAALTAPKKTTPKKSARTFHSEVLSLASSLVGGTQSYTRALSQASGVVPTMASIVQVREQLIPAALTRIQAVGNDIMAQVSDSGLKDISKMAYAMVPRMIPRTGLTPEDAILSTNNISLLQQDLDAFEASLKNEDFSVEGVQSEVDPHALLNAQVDWLDPDSDLGRWVANTFNSMSNNRHGHLRGQLRIKRMFTVERPDRDARFKAAVAKMAASHPHGLNNPVPAGLQPARRPDLGDLGDLAAKANVFFGVHGTRSVNVAPILGSHFRLPQSLKGVHITGAAFGSGVYAATDHKKAHGYVSGNNSYYGGSGGIAGRGWFMFLCDVVGGQFYYPTSAWGIGAVCPGGGDSVYAHPSRISSLANDEHVVFNPDHMRIRYIIEGEG